MLPAVQDPTAANSACAALRDSPPQSSRARTRTSNVERRRDHHGAKSTSCAAQSTTGRVTKAFRLLLPVVRMPTTAGLFHLSLAHRVPISGASQRFLTSSGEWVYCNDLRYGTWCDEGAKRLARTSAKASRHGAQCLLVRCGGTLFISSLGARGGREVQKSIQ